MTRSRPAGQGFTLVEVLIAVCLIALAMLALMAGLIKGLATTSQSTIATAAGSIARDRIEDLKRAGYDGMASQARQRADLNPGDGFFEVSVTVDPPLRADDPISRCGLKRAVVSVYRTGSDSPMAILCSYFSPKGV